MTTYFYGRNSDLESFDKKSSLNTQLSKQNLTLILKI